MDDFGVDEGIEQADQALPDMSGPEKKGSTNDACAKEPVDNFGLDEGIEQADQALPGMSGPGKKECTNNACTKERQDLEQEVAQLKEDKEKLAADLKRVKTDKAAQDEAYE